MDFGNLDVPPMPPSPPGMDKGGFEDLPEIPEMQDSDEAFSGMEEENEPVSGIKVPSLPQPRYMEEPAFRPFKGFKPAGSVKPDFGMQGLQEPVQETEEDVQETELRPKKTDYYERFSRAAVREEREVLEHKDAKGPIFMRVDRFRNVLRNVSEIRSSLKVSNEILSKLNDIDVNAEKEFEKWKNIMADMQKKLVFVDKTLFKGDKK
ncbi:hypothetical protein HYU09_03035 [Candidatus Woesearchaeota archaeon]|nr:hypothetical protein [Candidatus Woesearchaeota archaeon]